MDALELQNISLNDSNLPYPDPLHPIVVHFVYCYGVYGFFQLVLGYFFHKPRLYEVSF